LTATKYEPFMFSVLSFTFSYASKILIIMIYTDTVYIKYKKKDEEDEWKKEEGKN
jgi:hypothetical protein